MRLTKLGHACVRLDKGSGTLVIDPGGAAWSGPGALTGARAVLVTHEHPDHLDQNGLRAALGADPELELWSNASVTAMFTDFGSQVHTVARGDTFTAAGFDVHVYGQEHAVIVPGMPDIANVCYLLDGEVFHPGDSFTVPDEPVGTLLLPASAPWLKFAEAAAYAKQVAPRRGFAIHDAVLSPQGLGLVTRLLGNAPGTAGVITRLEPGVTVEV
jgi:L-ascorbate metabolism protein UlaG (beta-lactamase superfamily)